MTSAEKEKSNPINPNWSPVSFTGLQKKLTILKYKCLNFSKFNRKEVDIDISDVMEKFNKMNVKFDIKRQ